jgi:hypothetical protein
VLDGPHVFKPAGEVGRAENGRLRRSRKTHRPVRLRHKPVRSEARASERVKEYEAGLAVHSDRYTVRDAVEDWLAYGQGLMSAATVEKNTARCKNHIVPKLGGRRLRELQRQGSTDGSPPAHCRCRRRHCANSSPASSAWCGELRLSGTSTETWSRCASSPGRDGRGSKAMSFEQARDLLTKTVDDPCTATSSFHS